MSIGPSKGNGFIWERGPWTLGLWQEDLPQGIGQALLLGHKVGADWSTDAVVEVLGDDGGWQNEINLKAGGMIGKFYVDDMLEQANAIVETLYVLNPYINTPIKNTDPYSLNRFNALISQYTDVGSDGKLGQKGFVSRIIAAVLG